VRRRLIPFLFLLYIFAYLDRINVGFAALQMNSALHFSAETYGLGAGVFFLSYVVFEIPSNVMLARVGARLWIARIMITWGLVSAATMLVRSAATFYALRFLLGMAEAGFFPGLIFYLTEWIPSRERAETIAAFMTAVLIAGVVGGPASGALLSLDGVAGLAGWQWLFLLEGVPSALAGLAVFWALDDRPEEATWLTDAQKGALVSRLRAESASKGGARTARDALTSGRMWLLGVAYFFAIPVALYGFGFWLPQIIQSSFRGSAFEVGVLSAVPYLAGAVAMVAVGRHSDRTGERRWHAAIAALASCLGFIATGLVHGLTASMVALTIAMSGLASILGPFWTLGSASAQGAGAAAGIALVNSVGNIGGFVGPYLVGYFKDRTQSFSAGLLTLGLSVAVGGGLVLAIRKEPAERRTEGDIS
jgi:MFS family permease